MYCRNLMLCGNNHRVEVCMVNTGTDFNINLID